MIKKMRLISVVVAIIAAFSAVPSPADPSPAVPSPTVPSPPTVPSHVVTALLAIATYDVPSVASSCDAAYLHASVSLDR